MNASNAIKKPPQGRPRSQASHDAIVAATIEILRQSNYNDVSIEAITAKAGVGKATIYRWWPNKVSLVVEVLLELSLPPQAKFSGKNIRQYLYRCLKGCYQTMLQGKLADVISGVIADTSSDDNLRRVFYEGFFEKLQKVGIDDLDRAIDAGELRPDLNKIAFLEQLFGPLYYRALIARIPVDDHYINALLDNILPAALSRIKE